MSKAESIKWTTKGSVQKSCLERRIQSYNWILLCSLSFFLPFFLSFFLSDSIHTYLMSIHYIRVNSWCHLFYDLDHVTAIVTANKYLHCKGGIIHWVTFQIDFFYLAVSLEGSSIAFHDYTASIFLINYFIYLHFKCCPPSEFPLHKSRSHLHT